MQEITYLFPYEKVAPKSKILIYGAGMVGQEYLRQLMVTGYCEVVGFLDRAWDKHAPLVVEIYPPQKVNSLEYDFIVLAFDSYNIAIDAKSTLCQLNIPLDKIVYVGQRAYDANISIVGANNSSKNEYTFAFEKKSLCIALKYPATLGDAIQRKALLLEIARIFKGCLIDVYVTKKTFIKSFYSDVSELNEIVEDVGVLYHRNKKKYLLSMEVRFALFLDYLNYDLARSLGGEYERYLKLMEKENKDYGMPLSPLSQSHIQFERSLYRGRNAYQFYNYISLINVKDSSVNIPIKKDAETIWKRLKFDNYIVVNYGNGFSSKTNPMADTRSWPKDYWEDLLNKFKDLYPDMQIIQCGDVNSEKLIGADRYALDLDIEVTKYVLKNALLYVGTEGGLVHLATQLGTKCVCLFGPTYSELFGYEQNINISSKKCKPCWCLYNQVSICARGMEKPECMYSIMPDKVLHEINMYLQHKEKSGL